MLIAPIADSRKILVCVFLLLAAGVLAAGENPPPTNPLAGYGGYSLATITMDAEIGKKKNADKVHKRGIENMQKHVQPVIDEWNTKADAESPEKLIFEPRVVSLHKPSGANRIFAGSFAGLSRIIIRMRISEEGSGQVIAEPEFYQHAKAIGAAWSFGATDNVMLERVAELIATYLTRNYLTAVGAATGFEKWCHKMPSEVSRYLITREKGKRERRKKGASPPLLFLVRTLSSARGP
ncbi:MAG: hypothetical protein FJ194_05635 [Gammaproteobacteria bacterium]|nr:hypothetical protein [Gammaproteobacteria bacterium]